MLETDVIGETVLVLVLLVAVWTDCHRNADMFTEVKGLISLFLENFCYLMEENMTLHLIYIIRIFMKNFSATFLFFIK